jgi:phospholipid-binding lipoprotein MlaA
MSVAIVTATILLATAPVSADGMPQGTAVPQAGPQSSDAIATSPPKPPEPTLQATTPLAEPTDIVVTGRNGPPPGDPMEQVNEVSFAAVQAVDKAVIGPVAHAYETGVPGPVRSGVRNFLANLHEPETCLNFLLQHRIGKALETLGRFAINSTLGVAGLFDFAKRRPFNLKRRYNGFANTLGFYGVKPGPYFFLPLVGATTVRDLIGYSVDKLILPTSVGKPFNQSYYNIPTGVLSALDHRNATDADIQKIRNGDRNPYAAMREAYLARRTAEIEALHSKAVVPPRP